MRKRRTEDHRRADIAAKYIQFLCAKAGFVSLAGETGTDYGIDLVVHTFDNEGYFENGEFKIQVKSPQRPQYLANGRSVAFALDNRDLEHWLHEVVPVIVCLYDAELEQAYWVYVQRHFAQEPGFSLKNQSRQTTIHLSRDDVLTPTALGVIREIKNAIVSAAQRITHG